MNVDWDLLTQYLAGSCTDAEKAQVEQWLAAASEHEAILEGTRNMLANAEREPSPGRKAELAASLRRSIAIEEASASLAPALRVTNGGRRSPIIFPLSVRRGRWERFAKIAAVILLFVAGTVLWVAVSRPKAAGNVASLASFREIVAMRGQRITFQFPDGSSAVLAPGSRLRIPSNYGTRNRTVLLEGEGAFTVTHDDNRPFAVHTAHGITTDLGTRFVVRDYETDAFVETVVAEGKVTLQGRTGNHERRVVLKRGDFGRVDSAGAITVRSAVDLDYYTAWTEGRLIFKDTPLREAVTRLVRWYDVDIRFASKTISQEPITAAVHDEPVEDVLRMIAVSLNLDLQVSASGRVYTLSAR